MGLSPLMVEKIFDVIRRSRHASAHVLVEQNARLALEAHRGYVMESGLIR